MISRLYLALCLVFLVLPTSKGALDFSQWEMLAVQEGGRTKPVDTFARETLVKLTGGESLSAFNRTWKPSEFILSLFLDETRNWSTEPLILIGYHPLAEKLGFGPDRRLFSLEELGHASLLPQLVREAHEVRDSGPEEKPDRLHQEAETVAGRMALLSHLQSGSVYLIVPAQDAHGTWLLPPDYKKFYTDEQFGPVEDQLKAMATSFLAGDELGFSSHAHDLRVGLRLLSPQIYPSEGALAGERFYNHLNAFNFAMWCYAAAFAILGLSLWFKPTGKFGPRVALACAGIGLILHITGMAFRCWIGGRPPVTNMYESMVWVSCGVMVMAVIFFFRYRTWVYLLAALPMSVLLLLMVGQFPLILPMSIDPLVPVLRSNYWLTIHVLTITLSYAAFALAMALAHIVLIQYLLRPRVASSDASLHFWLYRVMQLGVLLLAAGTILGGVWANYSWGRFWGWDPKEVWALITLLCYLVVLHGRIAGWWGDFGLVIGCVVCFLSVVMAWYGVNFILGKGLHSYGFGIGGESYVVTAVVVDLVFLVLASLRYLRSRGSEANPIKIPNEGLPHLP